MLEVYKAEVAVLETTQYRDIIMSSLLASVLCVLIYFYLNGKQLLNSEDEETVLVKKSQTQKFPVVTYWFPFAIPLIDGIITLLRFRSYGVANLEDYQNRFGKIYSLLIGHQKYLVINDVNMVQKVLSSNNPQHLNKPEIYDQVYLNSMRDGLVNSKFPVWSPHRKVLMHCFNYNCLQNYLVHINKHAKELITSFSNVVHNNNNGNEITDANFIQETIHFYLVKIVADIVMGPTSLSDGTAAKFAENFTIAKHGILSQVMNPFLRIPMLRYFMPSINNQHKALQFMETFFKTITQKYRCQHEQASNQYTPSVGIDDDMGLKPNRCLIEEMIHRGATDKEITDQVATFMIAGHESTHMSLQMLMLQMALNPHHQSCCQQEIDELIIEKNNAELYPTNDLNCLNFNDISKLKYLERCIFESARITPIVPFLARKLDASVKISDNLELSAGTNIAIPVWAIHRDPDNFPNPEKFDPDRFLPNNVKERHPYSYIPFSSGPRNCIAYKVALMEIKVIMAFILSNFDIHTNDKIEDVKLFIEVTIRPERNFNIVLKRRK